MKILLAMSRRVRMAHGITANDLHFVKLCHDEQVAKAARVRWFGSAPDSLCSMNVFEDDVAHVTMVMTTMTNRDFPGRPIILFKSFVPGVPEHVTPGAPILRLSTPVLKNVVYKPRILWSVTNVFPGAKS